MAQQRTINQREPTMETTIGGFVEEKVIDAWERGGVAKIDVGRGSLEAWRRCHSRCGFHETGKKRKKKIHNVIYCVHYRE
ncbi:unnamed protein product [Camellia sinensis]